MIKRLIILMSFLTASISLATDMPELPLSQDIEIVKKRFKVLQKRAHDIIAATTKLDSEFLEDERKNPILAGLQAITKIAKNGEAKMDNTTITVEQVEDSRKICSDLFTQFDRLRSKIDPLISKSLAQKSDIHLKQMAELKANTLKSACRKRIAELRKILAALDTVKKQRGFELEWEQAKIDVDKADLVLESNDAQGIINIDIGLRKLCLTWRPIFKANDAALNILNGVQKICGIAQHPSAALFTRKALAPYQLNPAQVDELVGLSPLAHFERDFKHKLSQPIGAMRGLEQDIIGTIESTFEASFNAFKEAQHEQQYCLVRADQFKKSILEIVESIVDNIPYPSSEVLIHYVTPAMDRVLNKYREHLVAMKQETRVNDDIKFEKYLRTIKGFLVKLLSQHRELSKLHELKEELHDIAEYQGLEESLQKIFTSILAYDGEDIQGLVIFRMQGGFDASVKLCHAILALKKNGDNVDRRVIADAKLRVTNYFDHIKSRFRRLRRDCDGYYQVQWSGNIKMFNFIKVVSDRLIDLEKEFTALASDLPVSELTAVLKMEHRLSYFDRAASALSDSRHAYLNMERAFHELKKKILQVCEGMDYTLSLDTINQIATKQIDNFFKNLTLNAIEEGVLPTFESEILRHKEVAQTFIPLLDILEIQSKAANTPFYEGKMILVRQLLQVQFDTNTKTPEELGSQYPRLALAIDSSSDLRRLILQETPSEIYFSDSHLSFKNAPVNVGLANDGATCYVNSFLQILFAAPTYDLLLSNLSRKLGESDQDWFARRELQNSLRRLGIAVNHVRPSLKWRDLDLEYVEQLRQDAMLKIGHLMHRDHINKLRSLGYPQEVLNNQARRLLNDYTDASELASKLLDALDAFHPGSIAGGRIVQNHYDAKLDLTSETDINFTIYNPEVTDLPLKQAMESQFSKTQLEDGSFKTSTIKAAPELIFATLVRYKSRGGMGRGFAYQADQTNNPVDITEFKIPKVLINRSSPITYRPIMAILHLPSNDSDSVQENRGHFVALRGAQSIDGKEKKKKQIQIYDDRIILRRGIGELYQETDILETIQRRAYFVVFQRVRSHEKFQTDICTDLH